MTDNINEVFDKIDSEIERAIEISATRSNMRRLAKLMAEQIRRRTRLGRGVAKEGGRLQKLKKLSDSYVQQRKGRARFFFKNGKLLAYGRGVKYKDPKNTAKQKKYPSEIKRPTLHSHTTPGRSNLTFSGKMLDDIFGFSPRPFVGIIAFKPRRKEKSNEPSNDMLVQLNEERGRPFFYLARPEINKSTAFVRNIMTRQIEKAAQKLNQL